MLCHAIDFIHISSVRTCDPEWAYHVSAACASVGPCYLQDDPGLAEDVEFWSLQVPGNMDSGRCLHGRSAYKYPYGYSSVGQTNLSESALLGLISTSCGAGMTKHVKMCLELVQLHAAF